MHSMSAHVAGSAKLLLLVLLLTIAAGCASLQQPSSTVIVRDGVNGDVSPEDIASGRLGQELGELAEFALMSAAVYNDDDRRNVCDADLELTEGRFRWRRPAEFRTPVPHQAPDGRWMVGQAGYDVWTVAEPGARPRVAIAFRGTDADEIDDWFANLRWISRILWFTYDQYDQVQDFIGTLVDEIKGRYGEDVEIVATGHSLGGGLAQQAAYASPDIKLVYAFDPSIVTGYYDIDPQERRVANSQGVRIYRIYEHGEILAYLRWLMKRLNPLSDSDPKIIEVRYNLATGGMVSQHSMEDFACELEALRERAAQRSQ
jgi:hypothetical protein